MTPDTIRRVAEALTGQAGSWRGARTNGAALGRALAAPIRARAIATEQMNQAATMEIELSLLKLAAGGDELLAELADSALREMNHVASA